jgi:predicted alternative tryptophan synthase beta-subunit
MKNSIVKFWENNKNGVYTNSKELLDAIKNAFVTEFINRPRHWKNIISDLNSEMLSRIKDAGFDKQFDISNWKDMDFDEFCKRILIEFEVWINEYNDIIEEDVQEIIKSLIHEYIMDQLDVLPKIRVYTKESMYKEFLRTFTK